MKKTYIPKGVCSSKIIIEVNDDDDTIENIQFIGGCPGNTVGVARLCKGMKREDVIRILEGTRCGMKSTSCPDQLAKALKGMYE